MRQEICTVKLQVGYPEWCHNHCIRFNCIRLQYFQLRLSPSQKNIEVVFYFERIKIVFHFERIRIVFHFERIKIDFHNEIFVGPLPFKKQLGRLPFKKKLGCP